MTFSVASEDHSEHDCVLVALMSHGDDGILYAKDQQYKPEKLWSHFTSDQCPTLAGKPKLFFIQVNILLKNGLHCPQIT
jgi:caspase-like apoptosis-related cysteine protease